MRRGLHDALDRLVLASSSACEVVAVGLPCRTVEVERLLLCCAGISPLSYWCGRPRDGERELGLVGFGETVRIDAHGPTRLVEIERRASELFSKLHVDRPVTISSLPGPCLLGGLSFRTESTQTGPWSAFADASFILPRWLYVSDTATAWLWLCLRPEEVATNRENLEAELSVLVDAIEACAGLPVEDSRSVQTRVDGVAVEGTSPSVYRALVEAALVDIRGGTLEKVVALASSRFSRPTPSDTRHVLGRLSKAYGDTTRFAVERGDRVFLGASPERLVSRRGRVVETDALAGTAKRGADDAAIKRALLESKKDRHEHALVVHAIADVLRPRAVSLDIEAQPQIRSLRNVHHLWTPIRAVLREDTHVLALVDALHPTPAVSGTPRDRATAWIAEHEPTGRGWYTGAVGWIDAAGDGDFAVAIRAGLLGPDDVWLYAGAGIVEGSDPAAEYAEILAKQAPMLSALGITA